MVILAAFVLAAAPTEPAQRVAAERQAIAMVRILPGAQVKFAEIEKGTPERFTDTQIRDRDGSSKPARLVEFQ